MKIRSEMTREELRVRLRRIEGQVRGVQKMLDDDRDCREIVQQLNAIRAAVQNATGHFVQSHARECLLAEVDGPTRATLVEDILALVTQNPSAP